MDKKAFFSAYEEIIEFVNTLEIVDTHEHLPGSDGMREQNTDILREYIQQYFWVDLRSAALTMEDYKKVLDISVPIMDRWKIVEPYWKDARHTGYGKALDKAVNGLYGVNGINGDTLEFLNTQFLKTFRPGYFSWVLKEKCKIKLCIVDPIPPFNKNLVDFDETCFRRAYRIDHMIIPKDGSDIEHVGMESGVEITSFSRWLEATERIITTLPKQVVCLKCALAYQRPLHFCRVSTHEAQKAFNCILNRRMTWNQLQFTFETPTLFQDYMMHFILEYANQKRLTVQFHTGLFEGTGNRIVNGDPSLMSDLFLSYPNVNFDIMHMGYPYEHTLAAIGKMFPNVFIDMCWAHIISPSACVRALEEWLDCMPLNKISAFGGDYKFIDAVYGHQLMARENVCQVLVNKMTNSSFDMDFAKYAAKKLFYDNPMRIFNLDT